MAEIKLENVCLNFPIYGVTSRSLRKDLVRISTGGRLSSSEGRIVMVKALDHLNLTIKHGERIGLIGHNGAGKSTLLRIVAGIYEPTSGHAHVTGQVSALLDIMLGMMPESTGYEYILIRGIIHGLTQKQIKKKQQEIADFTELGDYLEMPIRTYSSGMQVRLAFGVATSISPEILVLDEAIGAGDAAFMGKAKARLRKMMHESEIVIIASHDPEIFDSICTKVLWLDAGRVKFYGGVKEGLKLYEESIKQC
jgi:ABC-type polysaccharide/polyol phosphate transport system ATPase subunit